MKVEGFIIHLRRAHDRFAQAQALAGKLLVPAHFVDAVDAADMSDDDVAHVYQRHIHKPHYPFELRRTEVACFLSHRKAWQTIIDRGLDAGLIAEDDVDVEETMFGAVYALAASRIGHGDIIRLPVKSGVEAGPIVAEQGRAALIEPKLVGLGMQMQLVGQDAARALLAATQRFDRPVDTTIQVPGLVKARILSARPTCVLHVDADVGGTTVQKKKKPLSEAFSREIKRGLYRLSVRAKSLSTKR
jgi:GR25 family glycosyltransferase involved in LPS biosynthesis